MNRKILYAVGDRLLRYVYKNPRRNLVKLVKVGKLVAGNDHSQRENRLYRIITG